MTSGEGTPALLLDNVVKTYGATRAVDGVSLRAMAGDFVALLGPNGAGKTTLFQLLSGLFVAGFRPHRRDGSRHAARPGAGAGRTWDRVSAAYARS